MTLLDVLAWTSSAATVGGALHAASAARAGAPGYVAAIVSGVLLGVGNAVIVYALGFALGRLTAGLSESRQTLWGVSYAVMVVVWMPFAALLGAFAASTVLGVTITAP